MSDTTRKNKLIEVALPLDEINAACKADKGRNIGTIRNLHKWFAPMPSPAWRALLFAALLDDPGSDNQRAYLLDVMKRLVDGGGANPNREDLEEARAILATQFPTGVPTVLDPFAGGGSTLVEAQRLGLPTVGSDLNPVPALISRTLTQLIPSVLGEDAIHAESTGSIPQIMKDTRRAGLAGLASDVIHYASKVKERALIRLAPQFPQHPGEDTIAWLWARTARCPNPTCGIETILTTSWWLSRKPGERAWIVPSVKDGNVELDVVCDQRSGEPSASPKTGRGANFNCVGCSSLLNEDWVIGQGKSGAIGLRMTAVVAEVNRRRVYRAPTGEEIAAADLVAPVEDLADIDLPDNPRWFSGPRFGFDSLLQQYTVRQTRTLAVFADLVKGVHEEVLADGGSAARADTITTVLALAVGKFAQVNSNQAMIEVCNGPTRFHSGFGRNDLPFTWDFFEVSGFSSSGPNWMRLVETALSALPNLQPASRGTVRRQDARHTDLDEPGLVATDPPYFDAIGYADLSDYFYMWHRRILRDIHPDLYTTLAAPKMGELTAVPSHHGNSKEAAKKYFIEGFTETFHNLQRWLAPGLPLLVVYASKEQKGGREEETRWSSILTAMVNADLEITGTWPIHGTGSRRLIGMGTNAIATYIVMVSRPRSPSAQTASLTEFNRALRRELPERIRDLQAASILPVDLAQAAMGPGMQIYSRYRSILDQAGKAVPVEQALRLINAALSEVLDEQEGELDPESRFAVRWWDTYGWELADFGVADKVARPLGITVDEVKRAQVAQSVGNKVRLQGIGGLDRSWTPSTDTRFTAWEAVHHLADRLTDGGGELEASRLMSELGAHRDSVMALAYRLYDVAARNGRTSDQERYNTLINSWTELVRLSTDGNVVAERLF